MIHQVMTTALNSKTTIDVDKDEDQPLDKGEQAVDEDIQEALSSGVKPIMTTPSKAKKSNGNNNNRFKRDRKVQDDRVKDQMPLTRKKEVEQHNKTADSQTKKDEIMKPSSVGNLNRNNKSRRIKADEVVEKHGATAPVAKKDETRKTASARNQIQDKPSGKTKVDYEFNEKLKKTASFESSGNAFKAKAEGNRNRSKKPASKGQKGTTNVQLADHPKTLPIGGAEITR
jgi:hypothetical protein